MFRFDPAAGQYRAEQSQAMTWMPRIVRDRCIDRLRRPDIEPRAARRGALRPVRSCSAAR
jgi:DNA-directed RNA polymerase specialized sigma24 family protein